MANSRRPNVQDRTANGSLPEQAALMQSKIEKLYLQNLALERDVIRLRATQPIVLTRPKPAGLVMRMLRRLSKRLRNRHHLSLLRNCGLFDAEWYLRSYRDVAENHSDPARHYLLHGAADLRNPGPHFDTAHYLHLYPDIAQNGMNPLVHYILAGIDEGRSCRPGMPHNPAGL